MAVAALSMAWAGYPESDEDQIRKLLGEMTTEEKFHQTCIDNECPEHRARWLKCDPAGGGGTAGGGDGWFNLKDISRLNIRGMRMRDGPKGMTCQGGNGPFSPPCPEDGGSPSFPSQITRAATWNVELEESIGRAIGIVASKLDVHAALLPTINILPWLNWGRAQESYGEDPFFSGKMGAAVVKGVQHDQKVMATAKHFLANNIENTRWWVSAEMDEQTLHDVYLRAWALVVAESSPELIMTSYNRVQGKWAFTDPKFINILRNDVGFDGSIMTDWFASWEAITGGMILGEIGKSSPFYGSKGFIPSNSLYNAGIDMEMPMCSKNRDAICQAQTCAGDVEEDCTTLKHLDRVTDRILRSKQRYGLLAAMRNHTQRITWDNSGFDRLILEAAQEGIVLLKNEDLLPKTQASVSRLAVLGSAEQLELGDHGSSAVKPSGRMVNVLEGLKEKYSDAEVVMINGDLSSPDVAAFVQSCDLVVIDVGLNFTFEGEFIPPQTGGDRMYLTLHPQEEELIKQASKLSSKVVVAITSGASIIVENFVNEVQAILWMGYPGPLGGLALANILSGEVNPSGRMPSVTPKKAEDYLPKGISAAPWALESVDVTPTYPYSHGFKHMWQNGIAPRYPFGFGLSYTSYSYSELSTAAAGSTVEVTVQVTNQGERAGLETVQVYATCKDCRKRRLPIMLVALEKLLPNDLGEGPGFLNITEFPIKSDEEWKTLTFRERVKICNEKFLRDNGVCPVPAFIATYACIGALWWAGVLFFMDPKESLVSEMNMKRFLLYSILHSILGFGATSSLLGQRFKLAVGGTGIHFMWPGTICSPTFPSLVSLVSAVPARRSVLAVLCFVAYALSLLNELLKPEPSVVLPVVLLAVCTIFDYNIFSASRGEHYGYFLICMLFPDWINGWQCVQLALWAWAGVGKIGPWFQPVIPFITKDSAYTWLLPKQLMCKLLVKDYPNDLNPSNLSTILAYMGATLEVAFPLCCSTPIYFLRHLGAFGMISYHCFIGVCMPFASVFEWNYSCMIFAYFLFCQHEFALPSSPALLAFLLLVLIIIPIIGQLNPSLVPFLLAYRPYMGNWRFGWYVVHKKGRAKHQKLKTTEDPFVASNGVWLYEWFAYFGLPVEQSIRSMRYWDYIVAGMMMVVPAYRPLVSMIEKLCEENGWDIDDVSFTHSESYQNQVFGFSLGTGWIASRECVRKAYNEICGFDKGEMYFVQFDPCKPLPWGKEHHVVKFRCFDVTEGPENAIYGEMPYAQLAAVQPADLKVDLKKGKSITGLFLDAYY